MNVFHLSLVLLSVHIRAIVDALPQSQVVLPNSPDYTAQSSVGAKSAEQAPRKLFGRFLHVTDIHPDPHYRPGTKVDNSCHLDPKGKKGKKKEKAGLWGTARSECDTPVSLANLTLEWLEKEWADKVDFVIWTGDNARHDNDHSLPRTPAEINELNQLIASQMDRIFSSRGVEVVPSLGNNDIWPHNIMYPGPNKITNEMSLVWQPFIPFSSYQVFQRGAYFSKDIIPNQIGAISLNTLYWYDSNKAVEGCQKGEPGDLELDWLEVQLNIFRQRKMQVWLSGHVPPTPGNYFPDCYRRYGRLALRFQDTILGHLFGHMNIDHFFWIDIEDIRHPPEKVSAVPLGRQRPGTTGDRFVLHDELWDDFNDLPGKKKLDLDDYIVINVAPSVVPQYYPSVRVFTYNVTGAEEHIARSSSLDDMDVEVDEFNDEGDDKKKKKKKKGSKRKHGHRHGGKDVDCRLKKNSEKKSCQFKDPRHASPDSPSRMNRLWTPLGYSQFYMPGLNEANATNPPQYELEYVTYPPSSLFSPSDDPIPRHLLPEELQNVTELPPSASSIAPYRMEDLTIPSWLKLARTLAQTNEKGKPKRKWRWFKKNMYMGKP